MLRALALAWRTFRRRPLTPIAASLVLAYATTANLAVLQTIDAVVLPALPFPQADEVVHLDLRMAEALRRPDRISILQQTSSLAWSSELFSETGRVWDYDFDDSESVRDWGLRAQAASPSFFRLLHIKPYLGRLFSDDDIAQEPRPIVVSHALWSSRFGSDARVIDTVVEIPGTIGQRRWLLVGVLPPESQMPHQANLWIAAPAVSSDGVGVPTFARLARGVTIEQVRSRLPLVNVLSLDEYSRPTGTVALLAMLAACFLLFVLACVQLGAFHYSRSQERSPDWVIHVALGATKVQLFELIAIQALLISGAAALMTVVLLPSLKALLLVTLPNELIPAEAGTGGMLWVAGGAGFVIATALLIASGWVSCSAAFSGTMADARKSMGQRSRFVLVAQSCLMAAVVYLSGVLAHSYGNVTSSDLGFERSGLIALRLPEPSLPPPESDTRRAASTAYSSKTQQTIERLRAIEGVESVATAGWTPLRSDGLGRALLSSELDATANPIPARVGVVGPGFVSAVKAVLVDGAEPEANLVNTTAFPPTGIGLAVATQSLARSLSVHGPVIGQVVRNRGLTFRIIGVIRDIRTEREGWLAEPTLLIYPPRYGGTVVLVRTHGPLRSLRERVRAQLRQDWGSRAPAEIVDVRDEVSLAAQPYHGAMVIVVLVSVSVVLLALLGLSATFSRAVASRRHEFAVRLVTGADPRSLARLIQLHAMKSVALGTILGVLLGILLTASLRSLLVGVLFIDRLTICSVVALMLLVGWVSARGAAVKAATTDPATLLRSH